MSTEPDKGKRGWRESFLLSILLYYTLFGSVTSAEEKNPDLSRERQQEETRRTSWTRWHQAGVSFGWRQRNTHSLFNPSLSGRFLLPPPPSFIKRFRLFRLDRRGVVTTNDYRAVHDLTTCLCWLGYRKKSSKWIVLQTGNNQAKILYSTYHRKNFEN